MSKNSHLRDQSFGTSPDSICPISDIHYRGDCPVQTCPANLSSLTGGMRQGCYFNISSATDISSIAEVLGVSEEEARKQYDSGINTMNHINQILEIAHVETPACKYCGFPLDAGETECFDEDKCEQHTDLIDVCVQRRPYNIPDFGFTKEGIWRIAVCRPSIGSIPNKMRDYIKQIREEEGFNIPPKLEQFLPGNLPSKQS